MGAVLLNATVIPNLKKMLIQMYVMLFKMIQVLVDLISIIIDDVYAYNI